MDMSEYKDLFISEALEHLQLLNQKLVELEKNPRSGEALEHIFRSAHTMKGMSATMGYAAISKLAHALEDVLDDVRQGKQGVTSPLINALFAGVDSMGTLVDDVATDRESGRNIQVVVDRLREVAVTQTTGPSEALEVRVTLADDCQTKSLRAYMILECLRSFGEVVNTDPSEDVLAGENFDAVCVFLHSEATPDELQAAAEAISEVESVQVTLPDKDEEPVAEVAPLAEPEPTVQPKAHRATVRVNVQHLDQLLKLVSELVISRGQVIEAVRGLEALVEQDGRDGGQLQALSEAMDHHDRTLSHLHESVLRVRMVPMSQVFDRFPRMMRDLLRDLAKEVDFEMVGREVEMDRTALEALADPVLHLLRNAADHGLETPQERRRAGKPPRGLIRLSARRERGQAIIEVQDDGRGMDAEKILELAVQRGVITRKRAYELNHHQILMLICHPGFSTASQVTDVSGRGVGMDVVKRQVEALQGSIEIQTTTGQGTLFRLSLPLSLALTQALLVKVGEETYAVPLHHIEHTVAVESEMVQRIHRWQVLHLENELLPVFSLQRFLGATNGNGRRMEKHALVVRCGDQRMGLLVDDLLDKQQVVVKPLPESLAGISALSGTTVVGAGQVVLILDVPNLIQELV